jgi:8-oxo-dGTP diphosphatase
MSFNGQRLQTDRYTVIPRTLSFLVNDDSILLIRLAKNRGSWSGKLNGVGGHIERGEDPQSAAVREIEEETGIRPKSLALCGVIAVDVKPAVGLALFVFVGRTDLRTVNKSNEGQTEWILLDALDSEPLVEDIPLILPKALACFEQGKCFSASYRYDADGGLQIDFFS